MLGISNLFVDTSQLVLVSGTLSDSQDKVGFTCVQQGSLSVSEYEIGFLEWDRHTFKLHSIKHNMVL